MCRKGAIGNVSVLLNVILWFFLSVLLPYKLFHELLTKTKRKRDNTRKRLINHLKRY